MNAWRLDAPTWLWVGWIVWFAVLEGWAVVGATPHHTLTWHLRPVMVAHPLAWFVMAGCWLWLGYHFLVEPFWGWWWT